MLGHRWRLYGALLLSAVVSLGCERRAASGGAPATGPATGPAVGPRVASLVPAATDMLVEMGASAHLVAVSNYDTVLPALPRVGDYQNTDWEALATVRPRYMITQVDDSRLAAGFVQRAQELGIERINVTTNRLDDIFVTVQRLGAAAEEQGEAVALAQRMRQQLAQVQGAAQGQPQVRTLMVLDAQAQSGIGSGNFIDDLLTLAGGINVLDSRHAPWPVLDREELLALQPQVVVVLMPRSSPQVQRQARDFWAGLTTIPAVSAGRVYIIDDWWAQEPGAHVGVLAARLEELLHGIPTVREPSPNATVQP